MKVALGTFEVSEEDRKAIKRAMGFRAGKASRAEAREFLLGQMARTLEVLGRPDPEELIARAEEQHEHDPRD